MRLIDADDLKKELYDFLSENSTTCYWNDIFDVIDNAPAVEPERPQGEWIFKNGKYRCTACGEKAIYRYSGSLAITQTELLTQFCPNCGADMRGKDE